MKFLGVSTVGFGSIRNSSLKFAPKFTVIYGANEAGKSTWHAALYAAFCGMRRSRGQSPADEEFIRQYRPWDFPEPWEVSVQFLLQDGRKIELRQELIDRVDCRATDVDFGRDYSNEIINEGSPDGSVWLGLDRRSFAATACIKQSQLLEILSNPEALQTHLQRAAATCAINSAEASALQLIEGFRDEHVGEDRANSTRPLRNAIRRVEAAKGLLDVSKAEHGHYVHLIASENAGKSKLDTLRRELNLAHAVMADRDAKDWERRLQRVMQILSNHPERPSADLDEINELVREVSTGLRVWQERPTIPDLTGATAAEIEEKLQKLPSRPSGDLEPAPQVLKGEAEFAASKYALTLHVQAEPPQPVFPETAGLSGDQLRHFPTVMAEPEPAVDPRLNGVRTNTVNDRLIQRVHTAIEVWERRPSPIEVSSPTAEEIRREIETLPMPAQGDLKPAPEIIDAANAYSSAREALRQHALSQPPDATVTKVRGIGAAELRTLALRLREPNYVPSLDTKIRQRITLKKEIEQLGKTRTLSMGMTSGLSLLVLIPFLLLPPEQRLLPIGGILIGVAFLVWLVSRWKAAPVRDKREELETLQEELDRESFGLNEMGRRQKDVQERIDKFELPSNPEALEGIAAELEGAQDAERLCNIWKATNKRFDAAIQTATDRLQSLLSRKITGSFPDVESALAEYQRDCAERSRIASLSNRRLDLERQLAAKIEAEAIAAEINQRRNSAVAELRQVGSACEITAGNDEDLVRQLHTWQSECDRVKLLQSELGQQFFAKVAWKQRQLDLREQLQSKGLPTDAAALRKLAQDLERAFSVKAAHERWAATLSKLTQDHELRADQLRRLLEGKGLKISENLEEVLRHYREECETRSHVAAEAGRRPDLEHQLAARKQAENAAASINAQWENARGALVAVAVRCGIASTEEAGLPEYLGDWLKETSQAIRVRLEGLEEWRELDTLLEGRMLQEFKSKVQQQRENVFLLGSAFSFDELAAAIPNLAQYEANVAEIANRVESAGQELANVQGQIRNYEERPTSVSDAEEELRTAEDELAKIRRMDDALEATHAFLTQARDRIHRDIAPFLAEAIARWLPDLTQGRYVGARVDSETLQVEVCDQSGKYREASRLSHGTAEQIYLLLRLAMAEYLTKPTEVCPLILDDVTGQSDTRRKERMLATLKAVSESRQVILFTQEKDVLLWAKSNLSEPEGRIIELAPAAV